MYAFGSSRQLMFLSCVITGLCTTGMYNHFDETSQHVIMSIHMSMAFISTDILSLKSHLYFIKVRSLLDLCLHTREMNRWHARA